MRGGARAGAGRPKVENPKKMYSFRLSDVEVQKVRELLKKLRGQ